MEIDFLEAIKRIKKNKSLAGDTLKGYSSYLVPRFLSMTIENVFGANHINKYAFVGFSPEQHFKLVSALPWVDKFSKYVKGEKEKNKELYEIVKLIRFAWKDSALKEQEVVDLVRAHLLTEEELKDILYRTGTDEKKIKKLVKHYKENR